jgi:hypothetical protein
MTLNQITKMFHLCAKILAIQSEIPEAPPGVAPEIIVGYLQSSVHAHADLLAELGELLRAAQWSGHCGSPHVNRRNHVDGRLETTTN